jgi:hypothetical protein
MHSLRPHFIHTNLRTPSMTFGRSSARFPKYSEYFITRSCFNSNIHNIRHTLRLRYGAFRNNLRKRTEAYPFVFLTFQVHYTTSPNIIPFRSTLTPNIHLYSHTSRRPLIGSSRTYHPQSPYSEIIGTYLSLTFSFFSFTLFLSPFAFLSYFHCFLHVSCFGSLSFVLHLSYFLFPNIFEYLYTPVLVVCSSFEIISRTSPHISHLVFG